MTEKLSPQAQKTIYEYLNLPFPGLAGVKCPYFNNSALGQRGQLRVMIGKGSPREIVEEAKIISIQYNSGVLDKNGACPHEGGDHDKAQRIRRFLIDRDLGIDCSGFVSHVIRAHFLETKKFDILRKIKKSPSKNPLRRIISLLRPLENINVSTFADPRNSSAVKLNEVRPGDLIILLETGPKNDYNHIILVTETGEKAIKYAHARKWPAEGRYGHGVYEGEIKIKNPGAGLPEQEWIEKGLSEEQNETFSIKLKNAKVLEIRRLKYGF